VHLLDELAEPPFVAERQIAAIHGFLKRFIVVICRLELSHYVNVVLGHSAALELG
jgi:hypothetical protein